MRGRGAFAAGVSIRRHASRRTDDDELRLGLNRKMHGHFARIGLEHHYAVYPGGHEWDYWDLHAREALAWHARVLGSETADA